MKLLRLPGMSPAPFLPHALFFPIQTSTIAVTGAEPPPTSLLLPSLRMQQPTQESDNTRNLFNDYRTSKRNPGLYEYELERSETK